MNGVFRSEELTNELRCDVLLRFCFLYDWVAKMGSHNVISRPSYPDGRLIPLPAGWLQAYSSTRRYTFGSLGKLPLVRTDCV